MKTQAKMKKEFEAHIPTMFWQVDDEDEFTYGEIRSARKDKTGAIKVVFEGDEVMYFYHGVTILQDTSKPTGYYGRWQIEGFRSHWDATLAGCVSYINERRAARAGATS